jgi:hypothetical protein
MCFLAVICGICKTFLVLKMMLIMMGTFKFQPGGEINRVHCATIACMQKSYSCSSLLDSRKVVP